MEASTDSVFVAKNPFAGSCSHFMLSKNSAGVWSIRIEKVNPPNYLAVSSTECSIVVPFASTTIGVVSQSSSLNSSSKGFKDVETQDFMSPNPTVFVVSLTRRVVIFMSVTA